MKAAASAFVENPSSYLSIWGTNGNGKSLTAKAITCELIRRGTATIYVTAHDMMAYVKAGIENDFSVDDRVSKLASVEVLCVDELTQVRWTDFVTEKIETILDRRYAARLGTVLVMDENPTQELHRRLVSRMKSGTIIENNDKDMRPLL